MRKDSIDPSDISQEQHETLNLINKIKENENLSKLSNRYNNILTKDQTFEKRKDEAIITAKSKIDDLESYFTKGKTVNHPIKIYVDGVFDIMHSGHFNALRQSKKLGDILMVGVNKEEEVHKVKGPTLLNMDERFLLASSCKWADECINNTPYSTSIEYLDEIGADYAAHGDDLAINENGENAYGALMKANRFRVFKRTDGISTTNLLGRLMVLADKDENEKSTIFKPLASNFLSTGWRLKEFCNLNSPKNTDRVIYIDGSWDLLHSSHIIALKEAKKRGDFVYVGVHDDNTVNSIYGYGNPIFNLLERVTNILALKYVDDVVIGSPKIINEDTLKNLGITTVMVPKSKKGRDQKIEDDERYAIPKKMGILETVEIEYALDNDLYVERFKKNKEAFVKKYIKKSSKESQYEEDKKEESNYIREI